MHDRCDILIERKKVGRVIPALEGDQPLVVDPVCGSHPSLSLLAQEVDIDATTGKRL
jgi:hypothetical protein